MAKRIKRKCRGRFCTKKAAPAAGSTSSSMARRCTLGSWTQGKGTWLFADGLESNVWHHVAFVSLGGQGGCRKSPSNCMWTERKRTDGNAAVLGRAYRRHHLGRSAARCSPIIRPAPNPGHYFAGRLGRFRIVNRSLAAEEIKALARLKLNLRLFEGGIPCVYGDNDFSGERGDADLRKVSACFHRHPRCCRQGCIPSAVESAPQPLTADSARQALIGMLARGDGPRF